MVADWVTGIVRSGLIADIAIAVLVLEALVIAAVMRRRNGFARVALTMASGLCLLGAIRSALSHAPEMTTALWLIAALFAHGSDLYTRLSQRPKAP